MTTNDSGKMLLDDLEIGQKLIEVNRGHWSDSSHTEKVWEVSKKLKTRLVLTLHREVEGVLVSTQITERVIVREGRVSRRIEGTSSWQNGISLYTEDDAALPELRESSELANIRSRARRASENAWKELSPPRARRAIEALQAYLDSVPANN